MMYRYRYHMTLVRIAVILLAAASLSKCFSFQLPSPITSLKLQAQKWGQGLSQEQLMFKDECILVDENDKIIGHTSKYEAHRFDKQKYPKGMLHRAFSVFLFNGEGKLLLQKRASHKITFANVWTNTCCSHPLYGYTPNEVDDSDDIDVGNVNGIKSAAIRKLNHELGIPPDQVPINKFKYLGRIQYSAPDAKSVPWGEHEIDYMLFIQADVDVHPNLEEVGDYKYVDLQELRDMIDPQSGLSWSPWFKLIVDSLLVKWWTDLDITLTTNSMVDLKTIHRF